MKRNISILLSLCFIFCAGAKAQFVSQEIALKIAEGFFESYLPSSKLTAQALGEVAPGKVTRTDHGGTFICVQGPTSNKPVVE